MREQRSGTIVNISSIGARGSPIGSGYYAASKAALEAMTESLRKEVAPQQQLPQRAQLPLLTPGTGIR